MTLVPQLAESTDLAQAGALIERTDWYVEQKLDGHRLLLRYDVGVLREARGRNGQEYSKGLPLGMQCQPGVKGWVDTELVNGVAWAFDMVVGSDVNMPFRERREALEQLFKAGQMGSAFELVPSVTSPQDKLTLISHLHANAEGFMLKQADARYVSGARNPKMRKVKFVETVDCIVTEINRNGKESIAVALVDDSRPGMLRDIGAVTMIGKPQVQIGDVVEIRYLYVGANGRLYQPSFIRKRTDKGVHECTGDQLKHVNKHVFTEEELKLT